jgi:two-component system, NarL family, nitrate/nitrite response regulator NarL
LPERGSRLLDSGKIKASPRRYTRLTGVLTSNEVHPARAGRAGSTTPSAAVEDVATSDGVRTIVVAESQVCAEALAACLVGAEDVEVAAAGVWPEGRDGLHELADVVVIHLPPEEAMAAARAVRSRSPGPRIVALGVHESEAAVIAFAEAGVNAYLPRTGSIDELLRVIRSAARGEAISSPRVVASLFERVATLAAGSRAPDELTRRERQVLHLVESGLSNKEIATRLCVELSTVKNHVHNVLKKLDVASRAEAAAAYRGAAREEV